LRFQRTALVSRVPRACRPFSSAAPQRYPKRGSGRRFGTLWSGLGAMACRAQVANPTLKQAAVAFGARKFEVQHTALVSRVPRACRPFSSAAPQRYPKRGSGRRFGTLWSGLGAMACRAQVANPTLKQAAVAFSARKFEVQHTALVSRVPRACRPFSSAAPQRYPKRGSGRRFGTLWSGRGAMACRAQVANPTLKQAAVAFGARKFEVPAHGSRE
jgi:hypothetical protein